MVRLTVNANQLGKRILKDIWLHKQKLSLKALGSNVAEMFLSRVLFQMSIYTNVAYLSQITERFFKVPHEDFYWQLKTSQRRIIDTHKTLQQYF